MKVKSFYTWCVENNHQDYLKLWDNELNKLSPNSVNWNSNKKYYFKCSRELHESQERLIKNITKDNMFVKCKKCNSIGQYLIDTYGENGLELYWDFNKNIVNPFEISKSTLYPKIWFKCQSCSCHGSYEMTTGDFHSNHRCPYCSKKILHIKDSFAQWAIDNVDKDFLVKFWSDKNTIDPWKIFKSSCKFKVWIKCQEKDYHNDYLIRCNDFYNGKRCSECGNSKVNKLDSLGYLYPQVIKMWSPKNLKTPFEYKPFSTESVWWKCLENHDDYKRRICESTLGEFRCPSCSRERKESMIEEDVRLFLETLEYTINHENKCSIVPINYKTNYPLPFDNEILELKLIIEVHGSQHYNLCGLHKLSAIQNGTTQDYEFEYSKWKDKYKKDYAIKQGYNYLEIPYWKIKNNTYKDLILSSIDIINKGIPLNKNIARYLCIA